MAHEEQFAFRLPAELRSRLQARADEDRISLGELVRRLLADALKS